ncbi:MAG: PAS domain-containing protein [Oscillatoriales cyanobacterium C42_A2020_001]|nr:PAS domain-containing protein [Leptolyngbyaceae cyanobacterium C42_A2020_001]
MSDPSIHASFAPSPESQIASLQARNAELEQQLQQCHTRIQQLEAEHQQFTQSIIESTSAILYIYDLVEHHNVYVNHQIAEVLGYSPAEIQAMGNHLFGNLVHPDDLPRILEKIEQCLEGEDDDVFEIEYRMRHADGEWRWLQSRDNIFNRTTDGTPKQIIGTAIDISDRKATEAALHQSQQQYENLVNSVDAIVWEADLQFGFTFVSQQAERILGYPLVQWFEPNFWADHLHPDDRDRMVAFCTQQIEQHQYHVAEYRMIAADGRIVWIYDKTNVVVENGQVQKLQGILIDISDRKATEATLRQYEQLVSASPQWLSLVDRDYTYRLVSQSYLTWGQKQWDEIVGRPVSEFLGEEIFESTVKPYLDRCFAGETVRYEAWFTNADNKPHYIAVSYAPYIEPDGTISGAIVVNHDLTELKQAEVALAESNNFMWSLYNNTQVSLFIVDVLPDGNFRFAGLNPTHEKFTGITTHQLQGKTPEEILPPTAAAAVRQHYQDCVDAGDSITYDEQITFQNQDLWWITTLTPVRDRQGRIYRIVGSCLNVTERVEMERERELQRQKSQLLSEITLKIRESLNLEDVLQTTVNEVQKLLQADRVLVYHFIEPDWAGIVTTEAVSSPEYAILHQRIVDPCLGALYVDRYQQGRISTIPDLLTADIQTCHKEFLQQFSVRANLVVPLTQDHTLWGLLIVHQCTGPHNWSDYEVDLLQQLANQVDVALCQSQLVEELRQRAEREQALNRVVQAVRSSLELDLMFTIATVEITQLLHVDQTLIAQYLPVRNCWLIIAQHRHTPTTPELVGTEVPDIDNPFAAQLKRLEIVRVNDTNKITDTINQEFALLNPGAWLLVPIVVNGASWGCISLISYRRSRTWTNEQVELAQAVADQLAIAIQQATLFQQIQQLNQKLEQRVEQRTNQLRLALSAAKMATREWDSATNEEHWSLENYALLGYRTNAQGHVLDQAENLISPVPTNELFFSRLHPDDRHYVQQVEQLAITAKQIYEIEYRVVLPDGDFRWCYSRGAYMLDEQGQPTKLFGISMDVSDRKRIELERQQAEDQVRASLREKEVLLKEVHHRVKNNLQIASSLLNLQAGTLQDPQLLQPFRESQQRIKVMALIHEHLYRSHNLARVDFAQYIQSLTTDLFQSYIPIGKPITLNHTVSRVELGLDVVIPCGLIINELISNAIKHAFPGDRAGKIRILFTFNEETNRFYYVSAMMG